MKLLVDGDIVAYRTAMSLEHAIEWEDGLWTLHSDVQECTAEISNYLSWLLEEVDEATDIVVALTDRDNFRKTISPDYKANRRNKRKPLALKGIREFLEDEYDAIVWPELEADDVIGILATQESMIDKCIVVSPDKDLLQIPGYHFIDGSLIHRCIDECDRWHMFQTLTGDATDNYKGCPGVGPVKAEKILTPKIVGEDSSRWMWNQVLQAYDKAGLDADSAVDNARLAYILRNENYKNKEISQWEPPTT
tara:strand:+ start:3845 stop:4594 length:750 start_codon:yes stop_codon:yes gene_type:complete